MTNKKPQAGKREIRAVSAPRIEAEPAGAASSAVSNYKQILAQVLENRPSGTRQRLAAALAKNRSFVSQIANPAYPTPIPAQHLEVIFEVCLFPNHEREAFLDAYAAAHPGRLQRHRHHHPKEHRLRPVTVYLPDLENEKKNQALDKLISDIALKIGKLTELA
ncbi:MAG TPA: hypothetical protein VM639_08605 [Dongiaceae bacterium]|nr:hypothetical protein [Dongiaceae bacterium]